MYWAAILPTIWWPSVPHAWHTAGRAISAAKRHLGRRNMWIYRYEKSASLKVLNCPLTFVQRRFDILSPSVVCLGERFYKIPHQIYRHRLELDQVPRFSQVLSPHCAFLDRSAHRAFCLFVSPSHLFEVLAALQPPHRQYLSALAARNLYGTPTLLPCLSIPMAYSLPQCWPPSLS